MLYSSSRDSWYSLAQSLNLSLSLRHRWEIMHMIRIISCLWCRRVFKKRRTQWVNDREMRMTWEDEGSSWQAEWSRDRDTSLFFGRRRRQQKKSKLLRHRNTSFVFFFRWWTCSLVCFLCYARRRCNLTCFTFSQHHLLLLSLESPRLFESLFRNIPWEQQEQKYVTRRRTEQLTKLKNQSSLLLPKDDRRREGSSRRSSTFLSKGILRKTTVKTLSLLTQPEKQIWGPVLQYTSNVIMILLDLMTNFERRESFILWESWESDCYDLLREEEDSN